VNDFSTDNGVCWYAAPKFRELYPEYKDLSEAELTKRLHEKVGIPLKQAHPWRSLAGAIGLVFGIPLAVLLLGAALSWALAGFRQERPAGPSE
jgi:hypothetical protein